MTPPAGFDKFDIKKIYLDNTDKKEQLWVMDTLPTKSKEKVGRLRVDGQAKDLGNGVYEGHVTEDDKPASFRINVYTTNPKADDVDTQLIIGKDWKKMAETGYMVGPEDFRNFEATIYYKVTKLPLPKDAPDEMSIYGRGGRHPDKDKFPDTCVATCYKGQIRTNGTTRWAKEYHHIKGGYAFFDGNPGDVGLGDSILNKLIGQKVVIYDNGNNAVRGEVWIDTDSGKDGTLDLTKQNWRLVNWMEDPGTKMPDPENDGYIKGCKATKGQPFTWAGPSVTFRIDNVIVEVQKLSVREIKPPAAPAVSRPKAKSE